MNFLLVVSLTAFARLFFNLQQFNVASTKYLVKNIIPKLDAQSRKRVKGFIYIANDTNNDPNFLLELYPISKQHQQPFVMKERERDSVCVCVCVCVRVCVSELSPTRDDALSLPLQSFGGEFGQPQLHPNSLGYR